MRRRHKILLTLGAVLGVMVVAAGLYHWNLKAVNEAYPIFRSLKERFIDLQGVMHFRLRFSALHLPLHFE